MAFGARVLKTGIAVTLSLYVSVWFGLNSPVIAAIAAVFAMQPSIYRSWRYFLEQIQTVFVGSAIALVAGMFFSNEPLAIGIICILVIMITLMMKMEETVGLTLVTVIVVMEASGQWVFALHRFSLIVIGIASASLINVFFLPPNPKEQFIGQIRTVFAKISLLLRTVISDEMKESAYRDEKQELEDALKSLGDKYVLFEEELKKLKMAKYRQSRQLVVYKQMLKSVRQGFAVLEVIEQHYFQASRTIQTDKSFDAHLEQLIKFHEHLFLKYDGKLKPDCTEAERLEAENSLFLEQMGSKMQDHSHEGNLRLSIVAAAIYDYGYQLGRLDRLVEQYNRNPDEEDEAE
ncbi:FUSC family protein [Paenibacillus sp. 481]|uniref:FUSC family protein n=1 Tax=Paenibacillus sp. 481 TaxID=2835869 RepID=UPI001E399939|nr:aromatic acid exporter family protein [Paenibacillus sp. 481]UHA73819.1 aromatic acid exporter family protein [Paenibacillus sp. 481]